MPIVLRSVPAKAAVSALLTQPDARLEFQPKPSNQKLTIDSQIELIQLNSLAGRISLNAQTISAWPQPWACQQKADEVLIEESVSRNGNALVPKQIALLVDIDLNFV